MTNYYSEEKARTYNKRWQKFTRKTHEETLARVDRTTIEQIATGQGRPLRILDAGCGTGLFLVSLSREFPVADLYGIDGSPAMVAEATKLFGGTTNVWLQQALLQPAPLAGLPFPSQHFDLITSNNIIHNLKDPDRVLSGLRELLVPGGRMILTDYARRSPIFLWRPFEWLARRLEGSQGRAFTLAEAKALCQKANLTVEKAEYFKIDWLWHGWTLSCEHAHNSRSNSYVGKGG